MLNINLLNMRKDKIMNDNEQESIEINFKKDVKKLKIPNNIIINDVIEGEDVEFILMVE